MNQFNLISYKNTFKNKEIFCFFISKICNFDYYQLIQHFIIVPTKNIKIVQGIYFGKKTYLIQFIIQDQMKQDQINKEALEKEILWNSKIRQYTTQIDQIIQINFNFLKNQKPEIEKWNFHDENFVIPQDFYKIIILNLQQMKNSNNIKNNELCYLFLLNDKDKILKRIKET